MQQVYLHLGAPKTGTTFLQAMLKRHRSRLLADGVHYPPSRYAAHHDAARDLRGARPGGYLDPRVPGAWNRLVADVRGRDGADAPGAAGAADGGVVVISSELLVFATAAQAARALDSLRPAQVHLLVTVRDLVRQIPAVWQETVKNRSTTTYDDYLRALVADGDGPGPRRIWDGQDPTRFLSWWGRDIPPERVHLVTVPPAGADPGLLWQRFAGVLGVDGSGYPSVRSGANTSLGVTETEVVRRLNEQLQDTPWPFYARHIKRGVAERVLGGRSDTTRLTLPEPMLAWVQRRTEQLVEGIVAGGYDVVGDLDDLRPTPDRVGVGEVAPADERALADTTAEAAHYLARELARARSGPADAGAQGRGGRRAARKSVAGGPVAGGPVDGRSVRALLGAASRRHPAVGLLRRGYRSITRG